MFDFNIMDNIKRIIEKGASSSLTQVQFLELEISKWKNSKKRKDMITGESYYANEHDILQRKRTMIGEGGIVQEVDNIPNNKIVDNQYAKMVDQKKNYLLGKPLTFNTENKQYEKALKSIINKNFQRTLKNIGEDSLNGGIGWLHIYYDEQGTLRFKKFEPYEILPFWKDAEHTELDCAVRLYGIKAYEGRQEKIIEKVEVYSVEGIKRYVLDNGSLIPDVENPSSDYMTIDKVGYNWDGKIPIIAFKYNNKEIPLITRVKSLQDGINTVLSDFENNMQEDARNTILVIENYDGTNLAEFRKNLSTYGVVKVKSIDGAKGGVSTLTVTVNADNYKSILEIFKKALIENARGYDAKDDRLAGNPNQMNIQSMYNDIDLDANEMETEFQAALEEFLWFINAHMFNVGMGDFTKEEVAFIFNRDMMMNESEVIDSCSKSVGILSDEMIIRQHPWVDDVAAELERLVKQKEKEINQYEDAFNPAVPPGHNNDGPGVQGVR